MKCKNCGKGRPSFWVGGEGYCDESCYIEHTRPESLMAAFRRAESYVKEHYPQDLEWSLSSIEKHIDEITEDDFFAEYAFAVYVSGFRASVVQKHWPSIRDAYSRFTVNFVVAHPEKVYAEAMKIIANERKVRSIIKGAQLIAEKGWPTIREEVKWNIDALKQLPYIGDVLKYQVARNLGFDVIKPDVHLIRMAEHYQLDPFKMCEKIKEETGLPLHVIDTIIWRASERGRLHLMELEALL